MYERYFRLNSKPFALSPDPSFLFPSRQHAAALTMLEYGIESQAIFCLLTGEIGSGKTTVVRQLIRMLGEKFAVGLVSNTHEHFTSVMPWALSALGIVSAADSDIARYEALTNSAIREYSKGRRTVLIFDEAQNLSISLLEELRLLSNINSEGDTALQVLLVGQPELREKLACAQLTQFAQRVSVDFHLDCLTLVEARAYVQHRLKVAGGSVTLFEADAIAFIHARTGGTPRLMNQLCDLALVYAFAEQVQSVDEQLVRLVLQDRTRGLANPMFAKDSSAARRVPPRGGNKCLSKP
jgi:general secretion pathway protein A